MLIVTNCKEKKEYGRYENVFEFVLNTDYIGTQSAAQENLAEAFEYVLDVNGGIMTIGDYELRDDAYDCIDE